MSSDLNELTINYEEDGVLLVKELDKEVLSKGAWTTILYRYQNWNKSKRSTVKICTPSAATRNERGSISLNLSLISQVQNKLKR